MQSNGKWGYNGGAQTVGNNSTVKELLDGLEAQKLRVRNSMKVFCTDIQQSADKITTEIIKALKPYVKAVRDADPEYRVVLTPVVNVSASDVAPSYEVNVSIKWYMFFVYENRGYPMDEIYLYKSIEEAKPWEELGNKFLTLLDEFGVYGTVWDLPSAQKVGTILGHKRFRENKVDDSRKEVQA